MESESIQLLASRLGIVSLSIGIIITLLNLLFYRRKITKESLEIKSLKNQIESFEASFEAFYLDVGDEAYHINKEKRRIQNDGLAFWSFPLYKNEVFDILEDEVTSHKTWESSYELSIDSNEIQRELENGDLCYLGYEVTILVLRQIGKRIARRVDLECVVISLYDNCALEVFVSNDTVRDAWIKNVFDNIDRKMGDVSKKRSNLGDMDTGKGVMFPLFISRVFRSKSSNLVRFSTDKLYIPLRLLYKDDLKNVEKEFEIRPMIENGFELSAGITERG